MKKLTKKQLARYQEELKRHNKIWRNKDVTLVFKSLEEYVDYIHGKVPKLNRIRSDYIPHYHHSNDPVYSLTDEGVLPLGTVEKKEKPQYSGTYVKGIALAHKSNYMAIGQEEDPESYSKMRRN